MNFADSSSLSFTTGKPSGTQDLTFGRGHGACSARGTWRRESEKPLKEPDRLPEYTTGFRRFQDYCGRDGSSSPSHLIFKASTRWWPVAHGLTSSSSGFGRPERLGHMVQPLAFTGSIWASSTVPARAQPPTDHEFHSSADLRAEYGRSRWSTRGWSSVW